VVSTFERWECGVTQFCAVDDRSSDLIFWLVVLASIALVIGLLLHDFIEELLQSKEYRAKVKHTVPAPSSPSRSSRIVEGSKSWRLW
jgi:undecaprenyl pyrophosphate phosphatase UppP